VRVPRSQTPPVRGDLQPRTVLPNPAPEAQLEEVCSTCVAFFSQNFRGPVEVRNCPQRVLADSGGASAWWLSYLCIHVCVLRSVVMVSDVSTSLCECVISLGLSLSTTHLLCVCVLRVFARVYVCACMHVCVFVYTLSERRVCLQCSTRQCGMGWQR